MHRIIIASIVLLGSGCTHAPPDDRTMWSEMWPDAKSSILFEIKEMPKDLFIEEINKNAALSNEEKVEIKKHISPNVYTHCRLAKWKRGEHLVISIDQYYPEKDLGFDSQGHPIKNFRSGSIEVLYKEGGKWRIPDAYFYD
jgi:hypothetical protein